MQEAGLMPGIKVNAYAYKHGPEREMIFAPYQKLLQAVIIQDPVIDPLAGSTFSVNILELLGIPGDAWVETQVGMVLNIDSAAIAARGAGSLKGAGGNAPAFKGTAVFMCILCRIAAPGNHFMAGLAERVAEPVKRNGARCSFGSLCAAVDIDKSVDVPVFQEPVGGEVVVCGIKADIFGEKPISIAPEIIDGKKEIFTVMPPCLGKIEQEREFDFKLRIPGAEHIEGITKIPGFIGAVQAPGGIRVGKVTAAGIAERAIRLAGREVAPIRGSMRGDSSAVTGEGKVFGINKSKLQGGKDGKEEENFLECSFRIVAGRPAVHDSLHNIISGNGRRIIICELTVRTDNLVGFFGIPVGREEAGTGIGIPGCEPETVHKIIIRTKRRQLFRRSTAHENSKGNGGGKGIPHPGSEAGFCRSPVKEQDKKDQGAKDLGLIFRRTPVRRIKAGDEIGNGIEVEVQKLPALFFIRFKSVFRVSGKAFAES